MWMLQVIGALAAIGIIYGYLKHLETREKNVRRKELADELKKVDSDIHDLDLDELIRRNNARNGSGPKSGGKV